MLMTNEVSLKILYDNLLDIELTKIALSMAKYSLAVVGDPVVLCSLGSARTYWQQYVEHCGKHDSLYPPDTISVSHIVDEAQNLMRAFALSPPFVSSSAPISTSKISGFEKDASSVTDQSSVSANSVILQETGASDIGVPIQPDNPDDEEHNPVARSTSPPATFTSIQQSYTSSSVFAAATTLSTSARIVAENPREASSEIRGELDEEISETEMSLMEVCVYCILFHR